MKDDKYLRLAHTVIKKCIYYFDILNGKCSVNREHDPKLLDRESLFNRYTFMIVHT